MGIRPRRLTTRFAVLLAAAAIVPLMAYGAISILSLQRGTRESVVAGNSNVATRAATEIGRYVSTNADILKALAADLQDTGLDQHQKERILRNYVLQFRNFHELTLLDEERRQIVSSRVGDGRAKLPAGASATVFNDVTMSPVRLDQDGLPTATFAIHLTHLGQPSGWLLGDLSLEEMWRMVDQIRIGEHGYAMVVAPDGALIAHGNPDKKALVAQSRNMSSNELVKAVAAQPGAAPVSREYIDEDGGRELGVAARIAPLNWDVIVEQPTAEAYASATELQKQLIAAISIALLGMVIAGYLFGRAFIRPILKLKAATHEVAGGKLEARVTIGGNDEFAELGESFNTMANRLGELQENVKRQERQAMFGRVAAGLVHDLLHPIQNVGNSTTFLLRDDLDADSRQEYGRIVTREMTTIKRFLDDLHNVVKPRPIERHEMDVNGAVAEVLESMRAEGERNGVLVAGDYGDRDLWIDGDRFAIGRVLRNLITNAIQATKPGGSVTIATSRAGDRVAIAVRDTGSGIPADRLKTIFDEFVTTKRRGLGLGLAVTKGIVEQLDGTIAVESAVDQGTAFTLKFPARTTPTARLAAS